MEKIRAFIAIDLPETVRAYLGAVNEDLAAQMPPKAVRWVTPERMHLTLRFLGDTAVSKLPQLVFALDDIAANHAAFTLQLADLGAFPNRKRPRVIWAGVGGQTEALHVLKAAVDEALAPLGWEEEKRPFHAHLTLGRVKDSRKLRDVEWGGKIEALPVVVTAVHLIESQLRPSGPIYTIRHSSQLQNEARDVSQ